jgi:hypothetical protein
VFGSWQDKNWDPAVGSNVFDDFCVKIDSSYGSIEDAVEATGVDNEDVMTLVDIPGFDFTLLNYAAYVRAVGRSRTSILVVLTYTTGNPSDVSKGSNHRTGEFRSQFFLSTYF